MLSVPLPMPVKKVTLPVMLLVPIVAENAPVAGFVVLNEQGVTATEVTESLHELVPSALNVKTTPLAWAGPALLTS